MNINKLFSWKYELLIFLLFFFCIPAFIFAQNYSGKEIGKEASLLLSRLNLERKELADVKKLSDEPYQAVLSLLKYYKERSSVKHTVDKDLKENYLGRCASESDIQEAENALKHIFKGQGSYPPFFCGNDIDWNTRPVPDEEWVWQLNRMSFWLAMGKSYWHTGDEKYAEEWAFELVDWIKKNPNDEKHQYAWRSIEAGVRGYRWTELFQRFISSPAFTPEVLVFFLNSCYEHEEYLMTRYSTGSNWGLLEAEGLAFLAVFFPEFKNAEKWRNEAFNRFNNEMILQVYQDGHQRELVIGYHLGCIEMFMRSFEFAEMNGINIEIPDLYRKRLEKMCEVPMKLGLPDGTKAQFGDSWEGKPGQLNDRFQTWANLFNRDDFLFMATEGKEGKKPDSTAYALPYSGFYSMRSSWDKNAICMVLKCGPDGGWHCQPDNGTFTLFAGGKNLMPDSGSYIYTGDQENRDWFRQTCVHQTLTLNSKNSAYKPNLLLWKPGKKDDILVVENESYANLTHRRAVVFVDKRYFVIIDDATGTATGNIKLHFQLAPGKATFDYENLTVKSDSEDRWNVAVRTNIQKKIKLEKEKGQVSFQYNIKEPRPAFCYQIKKESDKQKIRFVTLLIPFKNEEPDIQVRCKEDETSSSISLTISENKRMRKINFTW